MTTQAEIDADIDQNFPTNTLGAITAANLRRVLHEINEAAFTQGGGGFDTSQPHSWAGQQSFDSGALVPTANPGDNSQSVANTAFVTTAVADASIDTSLPYTWASLQTFAGAIATTTINVSGVAALSGGATVPTRSPGDNTTNAASTAFVTAAITAGAFDTSQPYTWTGAQTYSVAPIVPTQSPGDNTTKAASTAFVTAAVAAGAFDTTLSYTWSALQTYSGGIAANSIKVTLGSQIQIADVGLTHGLQLVGNSGSDNVVGTFGANENLVLRTNSTARVRITDNLTVFGPAAAATSAFPALKRSGTTLQARLGDDSGDAPFSAGAITASGVATLSGGAIVPTRTAGDNTTNAASTAFVTAAVAAIPIAQQALAVTATNTLAALSNSYSGAFFLLAVNGQTLTPVGASPPFSVSGTTVTWSAANAGFSLQTTDVVSAVYSHT